MGRVKDHIMIIFKTKSYSKPERIKTVYGSRKRQSEENIIKSIMKNTFKLEKENETIKDTIIRDIRTFFELQEEKDYCKPIRVGNICNSNCIKYESSVNRNKNFSVKEY